MTAKKSKIVLGITEVYSRSIQEYRTNPNN